MGGLTFRGKSQLASTLVAAIPLVSACGQARQTPIDEAAAMSQARAVLETIASASETTELGRLAELVEPSLRDSVTLAITVGEDGESWAAITTHVRLGRSVGCALSRGGLPEVETPGGIPHDGSTNIICDDPDGSPG